MPLLPGLLAGALVGLGLTVIIRELVPAHPDLVSALDRLSGRASAPVTTAHGPVERIGRLVERHLPQLAAFRVPARDLALLQTPVPAWLGEKAALALFGLLLPALLTLLASVVGLALPGPAPTVGVAAALAAVMWLLPDIGVRRRAANARAEFARGVSAFELMIALQRLAGAGAVQSVERAAATGNSWVFQRINQHLQRCRYEGTQPWAGLQQLGQDLAVPELESLADIMRASGEEGTAVYETLRARDRSVRSALLARDQAAANAASESMHIPVAATVMVFAMLLIAPSFLTLIR